MLFTRQLFSMGSYLCRAAALLAVASAAVLSAQSGMPTLSSRVYTNQVIGEINEGLAGVSIGGDTPTYMTPKFLEGVKELDVHYIRLETITSDFRKLYDPETNTWNWTLLDQEIENMQATGAQIIANIFYSPKFLSKEPDSRHYAYFPPRDLDLWEKYVEAIVRHVNIEKGYGIKYWEIGNEPSGWHFFRAPMSEFWDFYNATARAIRKADPSVMVGGFGDNPAYPEHLENFFKHVDAPIDFLTIHWYAEWSSDSWRNPESNAIYAKQTMALFKHTFGHEVPMFLTEWNSPAERSGAAPERVAAYTASAFYWMQDSPLDGTNFFRVEPFHSDGALFAGDGSLTANGRVFKMYNMLEPQRVNFTELRSSIVGLASKGDGKVTVLLSRYDPNPVHEKILSSIVVNGLERSAWKKVSIYVEDAQNASVRGNLIPRFEEFIQVGSNGAMAVPVELEHYAVALIVIENPGDGFVPPDGEILPQTLAEFKTHYRQPLYELRRWKPEIIGGGEMSMSVVDRTTWQLRAKLTIAADGWCYPIYKPARADVDFSNVQYAVIRMRAYKVGTYRMVAYTDSGSYASQNIVVADGHWHVVKVKLSSMYPLRKEDRKNLGEDRIKGIDRFGIGVNSEGQAGEYVIEVSDFYFVGN